MRNAKPVQRQGQKDIFGVMKGKTKMVSDIESPIPVEWEFESYVL